MFYPSFTTDLHQPAEEELNAPNLRMMIHLIFKCNKSNLVLYRFPIVILEINDKCFSKQRFSSCTSECSRASTAGCPCNCEVVIGTYCFGEGNCFISFDFNVELLAFEGKQCFILAFPLLKVTFLITIIEAHFTAHSFALHSKALSGGDNKKAITSRPTHIKAAG